MKAYIQVKKMHSKKKETDYLTGVLCIGSKQYFINLNYEAISLLLDLKTREIDELPSNYESTKFEFEV